MKLRFTLRATEELDQILAHIDKRSPHGARRVKARIQTIVDLIALHPQTGRMTSRRRLRRVVVHPYPYLIFYSATNEEIIIHGVRHAARRPSSMPD